MDKQGKKRLTHRIKGIVLVIVCFFCFGNCARMLIEHVCSTKYIKPQAEINKEEYYVEGTKAESLTEEQKVNDFLYMTAMLKESYLLHEIDEDVFGFSLEEKNKEFLEKVKNTKSDLEFYVTLWRYFSTVNSAHTGLPYPSLSCYEKNDEKAFYGYGDEYTQYAEYWGTVFAKETEKYSVEERISFFYAEGKYFLESTEVAGSDYIVEINGQSPDTYIGSYPMANRCRYDFIEEKLYYDKLVYHPKEGEPVQIVMKSGKTLAVYYSEEYEWYCHSAWRINGETPKEQEEIKCLFDADKEVAYLRLGSFDGKYLSKVEQKTKEAVKNKNTRVLIIDLRDNQGGLRAPMATAVLGNLTDEKVKENRYCYIPYTEQNMRWDNYEGGVTKIVPSELRNGGWFIKEKVRLSVQGENQFNGDIYVLTDSVTCSAADYLASLLKENEQAVLVGENTSGEGLGSTAYSFLLPNSGLMIEYMAGQGMNSDGTINSRVGTTPDIYVEKTVSDIIYRKEKGYCETWEELLERDSQVKYVYEMIQK